MAIKVAIIGAGSVGFSRLLIHDILRVPALQDSTFALTDINARNLDMMATLAERDITHNGFPARVVVTDDRRAALADADYVLNLTRIGGLDAFEMDIDIPLKYGVDQCVGDTLCIGGVMYGQRNIPAIQAFCRDMKEVSKPGALFLNYANPNAINTWVACHHEGVPAIGLCHGVEGGHEMIAEVIRFLINKGKKEGDKGYTPVSVDEVPIVCAGINHQTWYIRVQYQGEDWTDRLLHGFETHPVYKKTEKVRIDMMRRFGYFSTESNGHLSEYVPWYRSRVRDIKKWISPDCWIHGETGGYLRICREERNWFETDYPRWLREEPPTITPEKRSQEHASYIIESYQTGRIHRRHVNVPNNGCITNLPHDAIVEVPMYFDANGMNVPYIGDLPLGCAAVCNASISVQRLAVEAGLRGDIALLKQAVMMDPLTGAVCTTHEISQMVDEMLVAQKAWLPQYAPALRAARKRLANEKPLGTRHTQGAARKTMRTVEELRGNEEETRAVMGQADKAAAARAKERQKARTHTPRRSRTKRR